MKSWKLYSLIRGSNNYLNNIENGCQWIVFNRKVGTNDSSFTQDKMMQEYGGNSSLLEPHSELG
jgi:hypothetical protein